MGKKSKITLLNITARFGGMDMLRANLERQVFKDFDLVMVDALWRNREPQVKKYFKDFDFTYVQQSDKKEGAFSNLAHADNEGFKNCNGDLIVLLQDFIWIPPSSFYKYWEAHKAYGDILVSGVGHQYCKPGKDDIVNKKGKITIFKDEFAGRPENVCWNDPRMRLDQGTFYETFPVNVEFNYCAIPRKIIYELGGMDEEYDFHGFAYDNVNIAQRAEFLGYKSYMDQTNECRALNHDKWAMETHKKDRATSIADFHIKRMRETARGEFPIKLNYLK
jgi:hypothetical protein